MHGFVIVKYPEPGHLYVFFEAMVEAAAHHAVFPAAYHVILFDHFEGQSNRIFIGAGLDPQHLSEPIVPGDRFRFHAVYQVHGQFVGSGGDKIEPVGGKSGRHNGYRDDPVTKSPNAGISLEHFLIVEYVGPSNVERLSEGIFAAQHSGQEGDYVPDAYGLGSGKHPFRGYHYRQFLTQVADDLEGGTPGAHNDAGPQNRQLKGTLRKDVLHILPRLQVPGELIFIDNAAQVDHLRGPGPFHIPVEIHGNFCLAQVEITGGAAHGVQQEVCRVKVV